MAFRLKVTQRGSRGAERKPLDPKCDKETVYRGCNVSSRPRVRERRAAI